MSLWVNNPGFDKFPRRENKPIQSKRGTHMQRLLLFITIATLSYQITRPAAMERIDSNKRVKTEQQAHAQPAFAGYESQAELGPAVVKTSSYAKTFTHNEASLRDPASADGMAATARRSPSEAWDREKKSAASVVAVVNKAKKADFTSRDPLLPQDLPGELHELIRAYCRNNYDFIPIVYLAPVALETLALNKDDIEAQLKNSMVKQDNTRQLRRYCYGGDNTSRTTVFNNQMVLKGSLGELNIPGPLTLEQSNQEPITLPMNCTEQISSVAMHPLHDIILFGSGEGCGISITTKTGLPICGLPHGAIIAVTILDAGSIIAQQQDQKIVVWQQNSQPLHNFTLEKLESLKQLLETIQRQSTTCIFSKEQRPDYIKRGNYLRVRIITPLQMQFFKNLPEALQEKICRFFECDIVTEEESKQMIDAADRLINQ